MNDKPIIIPLHIAARYGIYDVSPFMKRSNNGNSRRNTQSSSKSNIHSTDDYEYMYDDAPQFSSEECEGHFETTKPTWHPTSNKDKSAVKSRCVVETLAPNHHGVEPEPSPYIDMCHGRHSVHVTISSGASHNFITASYAWKLGLHVSSVHSVDYQNARPRGLDIIGAVSCLLYRQGKAYNFDAMVVLNLMVDILAGIPFLTKYDIAVRPAKHILIINGVEQVAYSPKCVGKSHLKERPLHHNAPPKHNVSAKISISHDKDNIKKQKAAIWAIIQQDRQTQNLRSLQCGDSMVNHDDDITYGVSTQPKRQQHTVDSNTQGTHPTSHPIVCKRIIASNQPDSHYDVPQTRSVDHSVFYATGFTSSLDYKRTSDAQYIDPIGASSNISAEPFMSREKKEPDHTNVGFSELSEKGIIAHNHVSLVKANKETKHTDDVLVKEKEVAKHTVDIIVKEKDDTKYANMIVMEKDETNHIDDMLVKEKVDALTMHISMLVKE